MPDARFRIREIALSGRLRTADDPATIGPTDLSVCKNMRPWDQYPRGIGGMTKINTAALASTGIRNGFHFRKALPAESHLMAWTTDGKVWKNDTAIPNQGAFTGTALFTDTAGGTTGRFSPAPGGALAYANGKEACLWGGTEHRCAGLIDFPATGQVYDYSDLITNTKTDASNIATIHAINAPSDSNTLLMLHFDNNVTDDSPVSSHTVTNSAVTFSNTIYKFNTYSAYFNGASYLSIPDDADFDFSGGVWSMDFWFRAPAAASGTYVLYHHGTNSTNYMQVQAVYSTVSELWQLKLSIVATTEVVSLTSGAVYIAPDQFVHVEIAESANNYYLFYNGNLVGYVSDTDRAANYTGVVYIGSDSTPSKYFTGYLDEFRISNIARNTGPFTPPASAYGGGYASTTYIGSIMPLDGFKVTIGTANIRASTMAVGEWNGTGWVSVAALSDGTTSGGKALAQTGTVTFTSTASTSKPTQIEKIYLYWYRMSISSTLDFSSPTVSQVTVSIPFQPIKDIWDGEERPCNAFIGYHSSKYTDFTPNVLSNGYTSTGSTVDATTYADVSAYTTTSFLYAGFTERMAGITLYMVDAQGNTASVVATFSYWNGNAWVGLTANDGTMDTSKALAKTGWVTWPAQNRENEFMRSDLGSGLSSDQHSVGSLYYYRISFSGALSSGTYIYHVAGIPAPKSILGYSFPVSHQNRTLLICNKDMHGNSILASAMDMANTFNGLDSYEWFLGKEEDIVSASSLFLRYGSSVADMLVLCKQGETWLLEGNGGTNDPYRTRMLSEKIGCRAPLTMTTVPVGDLGGGVRRGIAIWESQRGIELFDGLSLMDPLLSNDIRDKFDPLSSTYAGSTNNTGFYDPVYDEYHWIPVGSAEWVFSFKYKKWYQVDRGASKYLYGGIPVMDTSGNSYTYGFDNAGRLYRLGYGTDFDGNDIVHTLKTGAIALAENKISEEVSLRYVKVVQVAKTTTNSMTVTHFGDTATIGNSIGSFVPSASGKRLCSRILNAGSKGPHVFHEFQLQLTTDDQVFGCEPIYIVAYYDGERQDVR